MKKILFTALVVGLLVPTAAFAAAPAQIPASYCKAHPELIGAGKLHKNFGACAAAQSAKQGSQHHERCQDVQGRTGPRR